MSRSVTSIILSGSNSDQLDSTEEMSQAKSIEAVFLISISAT